MTRVLRPFLGFALAVMLAFTAQSMAVARSSDAPAGQMVLCTGTGPVTIFLDEEGNPTGAAHICPDCAMGLFHLALANSDAAPEALWSKHALLPARGTNLSSMKGLDARARAPPVSV